MFTGHFARHQRLIHASEFKRVFDHPCGRHGDSALLVLGTKNNLDYARLGLAVSKKHLRRAVARNRFKRIVRESFRQHQQLLVGLDIVVIARNGAGSAQNSEIFEALTIHWRQLKERCEKY